MFNYTIPLRRHSYYERKIIVAHSELSGAMAFCKTGLYWFLYSSYPVIQAVIRIVTAQYCK